MLGREREHRLAAKQQRLLGLVGLQQAAGLPQGDERAVKHLCAGIQQRRLAERQSCPLRVPQADQGIAHMKVQLSLGVSERGIAALVGP